MNPVTVTILPQDDAGPNSGILVGASSAFACLSLFDDDAEYIRLLGQGGLNACGLDWTAVPLASVINSVTVRWREAGTSSDVAFASAGLQWGGAQYLAPSRALSPHAYGTMDEVLLLNPFTGGHWTAAWLRENDPDLLHRQDFMPQEVGYPRLTALVALVNYTPRAFAHVSSGGGSARLSSSRNTAEGSSS